MTPSAGLDAPLRILLEKLWIDDEMSPLWEALNFHLEKHDNVWNIETQCTAANNLYNISFIRLERKNSLDKQDVFSVIMPTDWHSTLISRFY